MKSILSKILNRVLTVVIVIQLIFCVILMVRSAGGGDGDLFGYRFYYITSPSMEPEIMVGSQIIVKETDRESLRVNDIITFKSRDPSIMGYPNTHRIVEITKDEYGNKAFVTKGDNNLTSDSYLVYPEEIYGKVVAVSPVLKGLIMFYSFASTPMGFTVVVVMPLFLVFGILMRSLIREIRHSEKESEGESDAASPSEITYDEELIAAIVKAYVRENPNKELTAEEAQEVAADLVKILIRKGDGTENG